MIQGSLMATHKNSFYFIHQMIMKYRPFLKTFLVKKIRTPTFRIRAVNATSASRVKAKLSP
jgi:hypothetical protein